MDDAMSALSGTRTAMCWSSTRFSTAQPHPPESEPASVAPRSLLTPPGGRAVTGVATSNGKGRQPGFPPDDPELIGGYQLVRLVQRPEIDLDLVAAAGKDRGDRKSTRLNSSHVRSSYAVFCLKKKTIRPACALAEN